MLQIEDPSRPNCDYIVVLFVFYISGDQVDDHRLSPVSTASHVCKFLLTNVFIKKRTCKLLKVSNDGVFLKLIYLNLICICVQSIRGAAKDGDDDDRAKCDVSLRVFNIFPI